MDLRADTRRGSSAIPTQIVLSLIYVGIAVLFLSILPAYFQAGTLPNSLAPVRAAMWLTHQGGADQVRWTFASVGILLVLYLWVRSRSPSTARSPAALWIHVAAAGLILLLQWQIVLMLRSIPRFYLEQVFP